MGLFPFSIFRNPLITVERWETDVKCQECTAQRQPHAAGPENPGLYRRAHSVLPKRVAARRKEARGRAGAVLPESSMNYVIRVPPFTLSLFFRAFSLPTFPPNADTPMFFYFSLSSLFRQK